MGATHVESKKTVLVPTVSSLLCKVLMFLSHIFFPMSEFDFTQILPLAILVSLRLLKARLLSCFRCFMVMQSTDCFAAKLEKRHIL